MFSRRVKSTISSALTTSRATVSSEPSSSARPELDAALAGPEQAGEQIRRFLQARAAAVAHDLDELLVDLVEHRLRMRLVLGRHRREAVEKALVLAGGEQAPFHARLVHQAGEAEALDHHADRTDQARLVDKDPVGCRSQVVAAGGAHLLDHRIERNRRIELAQALDLVADDAGLNRTAAGAVDAHDDRGRLLVLERLPSASLTVSASTSPRDSMTPLISISAVCRPLPTPRARPNKPIPTRRPAAAMRPRGTGRRSASAAPGAARSTHRVPAPRSGVRCQAGSAAWAGAAAACGRPS